MGQISPTGAAGPEYRPGPMAWIVDRLIEERLGYSLLDIQIAGSDSVRLVDEKELDAQGKPGPKLLPGLKHGRGNAFFTRNAQVLGRLACSEWQESSQPVVAVLFRDADKTASMPAGHWEALVDSIARGFELAEFPAGVPMVPRPKSEAWLLCALKSPPYLQCAGLEDAPGNDDSPNALKVRLERVVGQKASAEDQAEWIRSGRIDPAQITMPSFTAFREALSSALEATLEKL